MKKRTLWRSRWKRWQRFPANEKILIGSYLFGYFICWVKINWILAHHPRYKLLYRFGAWLWCELPRGSIPPSCLCSFSLCLLSLFHFNSRKKIFEVGGEMEERSREHFTMFSCVILHQCNRCYNGCYHYEQSMYSPGNT